ncbi:methyl-accepting chemotaxis protein [Duganella sp.]|uniref:methyl-accepting chemotaxis protein n=1 Tax=Duganella sp. TaxID=1904440 RepID=UPI0031CF6F19
MNFKTKILLLPIVASLIIMVGGVISYIVGQRAFSQIHHLQKVETPALAAMIRANIATLRFRDTVKAAVTEADAGKLDEAERMAAELANAVSALRTLGADQNDISKTSAVYTAAALKVGRAMIAQSDLGETAGQMQAASAELDKKLTQGINEGLRNIDARGQGAMESESHHLWASIGTGAAVLIALVIVSAATLRSVWRDLGADPADLRRAVNALSNGDLTARLKVAGNGQSSVLAALAVMQQSLAGVVAKVRQHSESVASASVQIARGNQDLSDRNETQARALQQTASSMQQFGATVHNNADNAKQANHLAQDAAALAVQGGEVVARVVTTMQGINDSSRKIGDIISVIDAIAFQTNILALNAAVEAARAGEQGRGFAVVASEVRNLAQRTATAAKDVKHLIGRSVEQVGEGAVLVHQAGGSMDEIVGAIQRVRDIVADITASSAEQSHGVQQMGEAVNQIDRATQHNTTLVAQNTTAAEDLKARALQLVQAVAVFKLLPQEVAGTGAAPQLLQ